MKLINYLFFCGGGGVSEDIDVISADLKKRLRILLGNVRKFLDVLGNVQKFAKILLFRSLGKRYYVL